MPELTVAFADLTGSTGVFEVLGNAKATQAVTRITQWIGTVCRTHNGKVVKNLGDGVLMVFPASTDAVDAVQEMQRCHTDRIKSWPDKLKMRLQIGMACGEVIEQDNDFFGDAVNLASRLSDLSGPDQILASDAVIDSLPEANFVRYRTLGAMEIRGRNEACIVCRVEWQSEVPSDFFTVNAALGLSSAQTSDTPLLGGIDLSWLNIKASFTCAQLPVHLGRDATAQFVINDPRVSRLHARIILRSDKLYLEDVSSYGTWVRFAGSDAVVALRRQECVLLESGEIALGTPFDDFTVPTVSFTLPTDGGDLVN